MRNGPVKNSVLTFAQEDIVVEHTSISHCLIWKGMQNIQRNAKLIDYILSYKEVFGVAYPGRQKSRNNYITGSFFRVTQYDLYTSYGQKLM